MATVTLFYRDGDNYKTTWDVEVPDEIMRKIPPPDVNGMHDISTLGLAMEDIPLVRDYGFDPTADHPFVTIERCEMDEDWCPPDKENMKQYNVSLVVEVPDKGATERPVSRSARTP